MKPLNTDEMLAIALPAYILLVIVLGIINYAFYGAAAQWAYAGQMFFGAAGIST